MADIKKISELTELLTIADTDEVAIVDKSEGETKKVLASTIKTYSQGTLPTQIGTLASLATTEKTNLVGAINEVDSNTDDNTTSINNLNTGWINPNETWSYASATTINVPSGAVSRYSIGDKIKLTQTTIKYFYIVGVADTLLTITGGSDYTLANATIASNYYSHSVNPVGFPTYFNWAPTTSGITPGAGGTLTTRFAINGNILNFYIYFKFGSGSAISGRNTFTPPTTIVNSGYGQTYILDSGTAAYMGLCEMSPGQIAVDGALTSGAYLTYAAFSSTVPFTWTTNDTYTATGWYFI